MTGIYAEGTGGVLGSVLSRASAQETLPSREAPTAVGLGLGTASLTPDGSAESSWMRGCEPALLWAEAVMFQAPAALQLGGEGAQQHLPQRSFWGQAMLRCHCSQGHLACRGVGRG